MIQGLNGLHVLLTYFYKVRFTLLPVAIKETDIFANVSHVEARAFVCGALTDHTNKALLFPAQISPDMSVRHTESIIQSDWPALLEGTILACPAPYITLAQGHRGRRGGACYPGPVNTGDFD